MIINICFQRGEGTWLTSTTRNRAGSNFRIGLPSNRILFWRGNCRAEDDDPMEVMRMRNGISMSVSEGYGECPSQRRGVVCEFRVSV